MEGNAAPMSTSKDARQTAGRTHDRRRFAPKYRSGADALRANAVWQLLIPTNLIRHF